MEYIYAAMLLHSAGKEINEENITKTLEAAGVKVDAARVKALIAALKDVNIEEAIAKAAVMQAMPVTATPTATAKKEEPKEEKKTEEEAAAGLSALFG